MLFNVAMLTLSLVPAMHSFKIMGGMKYMSTRLFMNAGPISYKIGFMFPGQGAQAVGMGAALANDIPAAKALYDKASSILGYDLLSKCVNGPKEELDSTVIAQVAIFVSSIAALEKLKIDEPSAIESCTVAMGLSLGEYTALCFAGALSFEDGVSYYPWPLSFIYCNSHIIYLLLYHYIKVRLTKARGEAMQAAADATKSGMVSVVGLDVASVEKICEEARKKSGKDISIANYLVDGNYAVSGEYYSITCNVLCYLFVDMKSYYI